MAPSRGQAMREQEQLIPAATVVLVRDGEEGVEVLMVRRSDDLRNFRGMWVFPGGRIDSGDYAGGSDVYRAALNAAVRETAEEAGMQIDGDHLFPLSRWTAPVDAPKRFDTWFFIGVIAEQQDVVVDGAEIMEHRWIQPAAVLADHAAGELRMMPPTFVSLVEVDKYGSCAALLAAMQNLEAFHFTPRVVVLGEALHFLYRGDVGFETGDAGIKGLRHRCIMEGDKLMDGRGLRYIRET